MFKHNNVYIKYYGNKFLGNQITNECTSGIWIYACEFNIIIELFSFCSLDHEYSMYQKYIKMLYTSW